MTVVTGDIRLVTDRPDSVSQVWLRAPKGRVQGTAYVTESPDAVQVENGSVSFTALPGPLVMVLVTQGQPLNSVKLLVPDKATATLKECIQAAGLAADGTMNALQELAIDVAAELSSVPKRVEQAIAAGSTVANAAATAVDNAADSIKWDKGYIPDGIDLNNWSTTGSWEVSSVLAGRIVNAPDRVGAGRFEQASTGGGSYIQRYTVATAGLETRVLARTGTPGGTWNQWAPVTDVPEWVPSGTDLATMTTNGVWVSPSAAWTNGLSGLPANAAGKPFTLKVEVSRTTASAFRAVQRLTTLPYAAGEPPITFERSITGDGIHVEWQENTAMSRMTAEFPTAHRVEVMKQQSRLRRGGVVGTSGRVPVALSFDHGFTKFQSLILPHLIRLGLPCTVAVNPDTLGSGESVGVGFADLQNWSLNHGIEIAHHGRDHGDVAFANASRLREKLLSTIPEFKTEMPEVISDAFIMPGASGTFYAGFDAALDPEKWWTHAAGRMIDDNFAVVTSALEGQFVPVTGTPVRAVDRMTLDSTSFVSRAESDIRSLVGTGLGVHVFAHPNVIDQEGRTSAARLVSFLEFLASLRDAGEIEVLTVSGFAWADTSSDFRMNLAPESNWAGNTATIQVGRIMDYLSGAQVVVETTAATSGSLTMTATSDTGGLNASATHTATAGGRYRLAFSIPKSATTITLTAPGSARSAMIV